ncbi:ATP-dependent Clp protease ATP-binding subunit [Ammoniphilus sp. YIM 78166]|uniref:ATP-dependent Clp protease ATP-binding subunit n=1 Tax=Ammoniphilus sp. YIM 78166 TaxID=1644106 RepID=UPI00106FE10F|nr:ATP-dependent Clp protease ATP-binding subunit [Ammoniphilus sp. YIM 78166]
MQCQQCQESQAHMRVNIVINNKARTMHLCSECFNTIGQPSGFKMGKGGMEDLFKSFGFMSPSLPSQSSDQRKSSILDQVGRNLTDMAKAGLIDPVIGRDEEIKRVIEILNRRNKNNPVLIGEPGVGKTAIAEGLALRIIEVDVPSKLQGKVVYTLDVSSLVAGTGIRGQFEEKLKEIIHELQARKNIILFIDEIHLLVGAGKAEGSMDAGNILKPALARGELQVVGATTLKEYRMIEKDAALERRFQPVTVKEPSVEEAYEILKGIRSKYETYHQVSYSDEVLRACVELSHRYIQDRFLPDKAIDLLDEAGSKVNLRSSSQNTEEIRLKLEQISAEKAQATEQEDYERAAKLRDQESKLLRHLDEMDTELAKTDVSVEDIQEIIERKTGIPVKKLQKDEQEKMKNLAQILSEKVIGQADAITKVAKAIRRSRAGFKPKNRPIASFLFVGPTGVGKTELTKALAEELFGTKDSMIRLDMSEYMEKHSVSKLIGSPPGYVGHDEAGQLTEQVRRNPYSIILLDEIEKAHPDVSNLFLQILEDGRLTDSQGRTVNFKDTVIIATSNAGVTDKKITVGFGAESDNTSTFLSNLGAYFRPEFLNRFDAIIPFHHLEKEDLVEIVDLMLRDVIRSLEEQGIQFNITEDAKDKLAELGLSPQFGARPLRRVIQQYVEDGITDVILEEENVTSITISIEDNAISVLKN